MGAAHDFAAAHVVCKADAASVTIELAGRTGEPASVPGLSVATVVGRELVGSLLVTDDSIILVPAGAAGLVRLQFKLPRAHGVKEILCDIALTAPDDDRVGIGQVTVS